MKILSYIIIAGILIAGALGCGRRSVEEVSWTTMGTIATFKCRDTRDLGKAQTVRETFSAIEKLLNAHDETSELRRLANFSDDEILTRCDASVRPCYEAAFRWREATAGAFNPRWRGEGTMDLGGIAKGYALDVAAAKIGVCDALIDLGGNLKACGGDWKVGIYGTDKIITLTGGMASSTSGEYFRGHHIKDGRTGGEITNAALSVTVLHPTSAMDADALSTILFITGAPDADSLDPAATVIWSN